MPETFGSGTAPASWDPQARATSFLIANIADGDEQDVPLEASVLYVITGIEVVSYTGSGGVLTFGINGATTVRFLSLNLGAGQDAFSWRGSMVIPGQSGQSLGVDNVIGGTAVDVVISGLVIPHTNS